MVLSARKAVEALVAVGSDAVGVKLLAEYQCEIQFRNQLIISFKLVYFTVLLGFGGWSLFKGYYLRRMIGLKPELSTNES